MDQPYTPIDCARHDELLARASLRRACTLLVETPGAAPLLLSGVIEDVDTRAGAEYLRLRDGPTVRLDHIAMLDGLPFR